MNTKQTEAQAHFTADLKAETDRQKNIITEAELKRQIASLSALIKRQLEFNADKTNRYNKVITNYEIIRELIKSLGYKAVNSDCLNGSDGTAFFNSDLEYIGLTREDLDTEAIYSYLGIDEPETEPESEEEEIGTLKQKWEELPKDDFKGLGL